VPIAALTPPLTLAEVNAYFVVSQNAAAWAALTDPQKNLAIALSTQWLETLEWNGEKADPLQEGKLPRVGVTCNGIEATADELPFSVGMAFCELALAIHRNGGALIPAEAAEGVSGLTKQERIEGALTVEYFAPAVRLSSGAKESDPALIKAFPWLRDMLTCWVDFGDSRMIRRYRG
jgi:hypothetical protein